MRNLNSMRTFDKVLCSSAIAQQIRRARHVREPFSDSDILDLQDAFLNNGIHYIQVDDIQSGRSLIHLFLKSLNHYHNITSLTLSSSQLATDTADLYGELILGGQLEKTASCELEEFFLDQFYYDFMWIEASDELIVCSWFVSFFKQMTQFKLDQLIPILVLSYKK